jgi:GH18 family chitinase/chitodextrinase
MASSSQAASTKSVTSLPTGSWDDAQIGSYFTQWGVYGRNFKVINVHQSGQASRLTFINYAFGNIYQQADGSYKCGIVNKAEPGASNPSAPDAGTGGDAWADFGMGYSTATSVDGVADTWDSPLAGNFGQLKKLKAMYPKIKIFISLGGWTWSKWFSAASATDSLRKTLVSSCIDLYIKGNLPVVDGRGGPNVAAGVFDGIDIDWEYPGGGGQPYNTFDSTDHLRFTALLKEFRTQLDAYSQIKSTRYGLTVAIGSGGDKIQNTDPAEYSQYLDWINIMSYDYHGGWDAQGPTDFQSHLYNDPASPSQGGWLSTYNLNASVVTLIQRGVSPSKIVMGLPFYGRGWTGVPATNNGLYQPASGPAPGTYEAGIEDYKVLVNAGGQEFYSSITHQSWKYISNSKTFWSYDTPAVIKEKVQYGLSLGLRGVFSWSLDGDFGNVLTDAMATYNGGIVNPPQSTTKQTSSTVPPLTVSSQVPSPASSQVVTTSVAPAPSGTSLPCASYPIAAAGEQCGSTTGKRCASGCCSQWGWCGTASGNCVSGCQLGFGECLSNLQPSCPGGSVIPVQSSTQPTSTLQLTSAQTTAVQTTAAQTSGSVPTTSVLSNSLKPQIVYAAAPSGYPTIGDFDVQARSLATRAGIDQQLALFRAALRVLPDDQVEQVLPGLATNPDNVKRVETVCSEATFNKIFPVRHVSYTYTNLLRGVAKFPAYCDTYPDGRDSDMICRKLLATSFSHMVQETGANWPNLTPQTASTYSDHNNTVLAGMSGSIPLYFQGLWFLRESGYQEGSTTGAYQDCYTGPSSSIFSIFFPCGLNAGGKTLDYFGRGSKQLSWNYNVGGLSKALYGDGNVLLDNPARVADSWLNFASAVWFAVTPQSPKPPMTWVVDGTWVPNAVDTAAGMSPGFGATVWIINGAIECGAGGVEKQQVQNRINAYTNLAPLLGFTIPSTETLGCAASKGFVSGSAAATLTYLDRDWSSPYSCKLVSWQTPFTMASPTDYQACVDYFFRGQVYYKGSLQINNAV